jgi:putative membrane protein
MMHGHGNYGLDWGAWLVIGLFSLALLAVIFLVVAYLRPTSADREGRYVETPEETLNGRFAAGDLDADTYRAQREALTGTRADRE